MAVEVHKFLFWNQLVWLCSSRVKNQNNKKSYGYSKITLFEGFIGGRLDFEVVLTNIKI